MDCEPLRIAMAVRIDLGPETRAAHERIVGRYRAVVAQAQNLAGMMARVLCARAIVALAHAHEQRPVARKRELRSEVERPTAAPGVRDKEVCQPGECAAVESRPRESCRMTSLAGFRVREVNELVVGEAWMRDDFHQAALLHGQHLGDTGDRLRVELPVPDDAEPPD